MLTLRRGFVRLGWVLLFGWLALSAAIAVFVHRPTGTDSTAAILTFVAVPSTIFLLWRLLLWIGKTRQRRREPHLKSFSSPGVLDRANDGSFRRGYLRRVWCVRTACTLGARWRSCERLAA
jgi:hypothetical protein